jgi:hypothetical protein
VTAGVIAQKKGDSHKVKSVTIEGQGELGFPPPCHGGVGCGGGGEDAMGSDDNDK